jgi:chorismate mutase
MIETHPRPDEAWSDAAQQITPERLGDLLAQLEIRTSQCPDPAVFDELTKLRSQIDAIDEELLRYLSKRMSIIEEIGNYKKENGMTILQLERWKEIMRTRIEMGKTLQLSEGFIVRYLELIHEASIRKQSQIMNENGHVLW